MSDDADTIAVLRDVITNTDPYHAQFIPLLGAIDTLRAERDAAIAECHEQARLNGMGTLREARLMAERNEAARKLAALTSHMNQVHEELGGTDTVLTLEAAQHVMAERDAAVKALPPDDAERFICLAHPHNNRWEEALCSAKYQLDAVVRAYEQINEALLRGADQHDALCAKLAACERVVEAAKAWAYYDDVNGEHGLDGTAWVNAVADAADALRAAVAAETQGSDDGLSAIGKKNAQFFRRSDDQDAETQVDK
jgi:hypothetical protein